MSNRDQVLLLGTIFVLLAWLLARNRRTEVTSDITFDLPRKDDSRWEELWIDGYPYGWTLVDKFGNTWAKWPNGEIAIMAGVNV